MHTLLPVIASCTLALSACRAAPRAASRATPPRDQAAAEIRSARERYNAAIAHRDTLAIGDLFLPSYHLITGRSVQAAGRDVGRHSWAVLFAADSTVTYVRTPREVRVNAAWGLAEELGDWVGRSRAPDGDVDVGGVYAAKWQRTGTGDWRLQSEVFTTLRCRGGPAGCVPPEPVP
jgi:ketosteroid isomerase-like protein